MAIKQTAVFTRPSTSIDWPDIPEAFREKCQDYFGAGKRHIQSNIISEDKLTQTVIIIFDSEASRFDFIEESIVQDYINDRDTYCIENDIELTRNLEDI